MLDYYQSTPEVAAHTYGTFAGLSTFLPLIGGFIADRWNYHHPLIFGAVVNALGCFLIATGSHALFLPALGIIALGYGIFTPSILTLLGYTYVDKPDLREAGFSIYYASINVGVFLALVSLGFVAQEYSWNLAFTLAGFVQVFGLIPIFIYIKKHHVNYKDLHPRERKKLGKPNPLTKIQKDRMTVILILTLFSILFWMPYMQGFSSMSVFAKNYTDRMIGNFEFPAAWLLSTQSFFLIILAPILAKLYEYLQKKKLDPSPPLKTSYSLFSTCICFIIMMIASLNIAPQAKEANVYFLYPVVAYFFLALGEMLLAPIGLSLVTQLSPKRYTAFLVGIWYVCVGIAFYSGGLIAGLIENLPSLYDFFSIFAISTFVPGVVLLFLIKKINKMAHKEDF